MARITEVKLRAPFFWEPRLFQRLGDAQFIKDAVVIRQQRFTDVETGKMLFFQHQHSPVVFGQKSRSRAAAGAAPNDDCVVLHCSSFIHLEPPLTLTLSPSDGEREPARTALLAEIAARHKLPALSPSDGE